MPFYIFFILNLLIRRGSVKNGEKYWGIFHFILCPECAPPPLLLRPGTLKAHETGEMIGLCASYDVGHDPSQSFLSDGPAQSFVEHGCLQWCRHRRYAISAMRADRPIPYVLPCLVSRLLGGPQMGLYRLTGALLATRDTAYGADSRGQFGLKACHLTHHLHVAVSTTSPYYI